LMPYYVKTGYSRLPPLNLGFNPEKPKDLSWLYIQLSEKPF
jgi:hypothetical protein